MATFLSLISCVNRQEGINALETLILNGFLGLLISSVFIIIFNENFL